jgi:hypothetical protein
MAITINGTTGLAGVDGSASTPAVQGGDTNTGMFFPAADTAAIATGGTERMRVDSSGNVGIGTSSPAYKLDVVGSVNVPADSSYVFGAGADRFIKYRASNNDILFSFDAGDFYQQNIASSYHAWFTGNNERMRIDSSGNLLVAKTTTAYATAGITLNANGEGWFTVSGGAPLSVNRKTSDGTLVFFSQDETNEGSISVSGTTVSYNGGHLSRWAQTTTAKDESLVKGTVLSNLDEMNVYTDAEGNPVQNEQLNKVKVSDVEGDANVAGVFVNWTHDDAHDVDEINMAMTGDMIIRIAQGTTVQRGDLLMSAGDGTAKPQGDDIVRSKTVAKVTSTHVTCTYADGSFCVPCVLMAC